MTDRSLAAQGRKEGRINKVKVGKQGRATKALMSRVICHGARLQAKVELACEKTKELTASFCCSGLCLSIYLSTSIFASVGRFCEPIKKRRLELQSLLKFQGGGDGGGGRSDHVRCALKKRN